MSYSFSIQAASKIEAGAGVKAKFDEVVAGQPVHAADWKAAQHAIESFIDILREPSEGEYVGVFVSGSLSWQETAAFTGASINISAYIARKS